MRSPCCSPTRTVPTSWRRSGPRLSGLGLGTTLLVDTYDITRGVANAIEAAGPELGAVRIDSGDLGIPSPSGPRATRLLGAHRTKIVVSGDLDEYAIAPLRAEPVDIYGVGTSLVTAAARRQREWSTSSSRSTASRSRSARATRSRTAAPRRRPASRAQRHGHRRSVVPGDAPAPAVDGHTTTGLQTPLVRGGDPVDALPSLHGARDHLRDAPHHAAVEGLGLSHGEPAIPTRHAF